MGRPLVLTDIRGCREVARDGVEGLLVPPRQPARLAGAITALLDDRAPPRAARRRCPQPGAGAVRRAPGDAASVGRVPGAARAQGAPVRGRGPVARPARPRRGRRGPRPHPSRGAAGGVSAHPRRALLDPAVPSARRRSRRRGAGRRGGRHRARVRGRGGQRADLPAAIRCPPRDPRAGHGVAATAARRVLAPGRRDRPTRAAAGPSGRQDSELLAIAVTAKARGRGIGRTLAAGVLSGLGELGAGQIKVLVAADNAPGNGLYAGMGFRRRGRLTLHEGIQSNVWVARCPS